MTHQLKAWPGEFEAVAEGRKTHEVRVNDRGFTVGDFLMLREWIPQGEDVKKGGYTGRSVLPGVCPRTFASFRYPPMENKPEEKATFDEWALVELFGHARIVGHVTEQSATRRSPGSLDMARSTRDRRGRVYSRRRARQRRMSPVSRELALQLAARQEGVPVTRYDLPAALPSAGHGPAPERPDLHDDEQF